MKLNRGVFTISLDVEILWGKRHRSLADYEENLINDQVAAGRMLALFKQYGIHCTWATVGFLFSDSKESLLKALPTLRPSYANSVYDPYPYILKEDLDSARHFAPALLKEIAATPNQEIATHTFSHYLCLEEGQTPAQFEADLEAATRVAAEHGVTLRSIVFPKNQYRQDYLGMCRAAGLKTFRGIERSWLYERRFDRNFPIRVVRLLDAYVNVAGHRTLGELEVKDGLLDVTSSTYLRPHKSSLSWFEGLRLKRIKSMLDDAAANRRLFHLWWHPHDFGRNIEKNFAFLEGILRHYQELNRRGQLDSRTMGELGDEAKLVAA